MHSWTRFHTCFLHGKSAFANSSDNFPECPGWERYGGHKKETIPRQQVRMKLRQLWEHEGKKPILRIRLYSPELLCFSCNFFSCNSFIMAGIKDQTQPIKHLSMVLPSTASERANSIFPS